MRGDTNSSPTTPPPMRAEDRRARDPARPLGRSGRTVRGPDRLRHHDPSNTGPTCRRLGPRRRIGRSLRLEPTQTTEKADSEDGSEAGTWADNMECRSTGSKRQIAT